MTENEIEDKQIITCLSNDDLNDYYDMCTDDNTVSNEQLRRMFDSDDDVIIVLFRVTSKMFQYFLAIFLNIDEYFEIFDFIMGSLIPQILVRLICESKPKTHFICFKLRVRSIYWCDQSTTMYGKYSKCFWTICGDLKAAFLLVGLQLGCTELMCFLCLWTVAMTEITIVKIFGLINKNLQLKGVMLNLHLSLIPAKYSFHRFG